jgi:crossover junction endodeoxyribonuclease RusA
MSEISLPWPPAELSPNSRCHWSVKARKAKQIKQDCWALTKASGLKIEHEGKIPLSITFRPPSKARYDMDNCLARSKAALDGLAFGLGVDDVRFVLTLEMGEPVKGGEIVVRLANNHEASKLNKSEGPAVDVPALQSTTLIGETS